MIMLICDRCGQAMPMYDDIEIGKCANCGEHIGIVHKYCIDCRRVTLHNSMVGCQDCCNERYEIEK
jgi:hypothetical protein